MAMLLRLVFPDTQSGSNLLVREVHRLVCVYPDLLQQFLAWIL